MSNLLSTLARTLLLDETAYQEWRERPNLFLRGIVLIVLVSMIAGLLSFMITLWNEVRPINATAIGEEIQRSLEMQSRFNPSLRDPEVQKAVTEIMDTIVPMISDIADVPTPLPRGIGGFLRSLGRWLSQAAVAIGGWLFYGALVLIAANLLGGSAKLPDFLGMVSLYAVPGLLGLFQPIPCLGELLALVGAVWGIVVYIKATSVVTRLDAGRAILAVLAPAIALFVLAFLFALLWVFWLSFIF